MQELVVDVQLLVVGDHLAGEDEPHDLHVADVEGLVEPPLVADVVELSLAGEPARQAKLRVRQGVEDQEGEERDRDQHADHGERPAEDESAHQCSMRILARGSRASRTPSPNTLMPSTQSVSMIPGTNIVWTAAGSSRIPSPIMLPQDGFGGRTPAPR